MRPKCFICNSLTDQSVHGFPVNEERASIWAKELDWSAEFNKVKNAGYNNRSITICRLHFDPAMFQNNRLIYKAKPTIRDVSSQMDVAEIDENDSTTVAEQTGSQESIDSRPQLDPQERHQRKTPERSQTVTYSSQESGEMEVESRRENIKRKFSEKQSMQKMEKYSILDNSQLLLLLEMLPGCPKCTDDLVKRTFKQEGCTTIIQFDCENCGTWKWSSTRKLHEDPEGSMFEGNMDLVSSAFVTGIKYERLDDWANTLSLGIPHRSTKYRVINSFGHAVVDQIYEQRQQKVLEKLNKQGTPLLFIGDAQFDSRGFTASVCRYVLMDYTTKLITDFEIMMKAEAGGNSCRMELLCFEKIMQRLLRNTKLSIGSMTTDKNSSIVKHMKTRYPNIAHFFDKWHTLKNWKKNNEKELSLKRNALLFTFYEHIITHIWGSIGAANGNGELACELIRSAIYHVQDVHILPKEEFKIIDSCPHGNLPDVGRTYLNPNIPSHHKQIEVFRKMINCSSFLDSVRYSAPIQTTSPCESFHNIVSTIHIDKNVYYGKKATTALMKIAVLHNNELQLEHAQMLEGGFQPNKKRKWSRAMKKEVEVTSWPKIRLPFKKEFVGRMKESYSVFKDAALVTRTLGRPKRNDRQLETDSESEESEAEDEFIHYDSEEDELEPYEPPIIRNPIVHAPDVKIRMDVNQTDFFRTLLNLGPLADNYIFYDIETGNQLLPILHM